MANGRPLVAGTSEADQLDRIFRLLGTPTILEYPGIVELPEYTSDLPIYPSPRNGIGSLVPRLDSHGVDLLCRMLKYDPARRITAQDALSHVYFDDIKVSSSATRVLK
jgi:cyclin-dependent kinase